MNKNSAYCVIPPNGFHTQGQSMEPKDESEDQLLSLCFHTATTTLQPTPQRFKNSKQYANVFRNLLDLEIECKKLEESWSYENIEVRWDVAFNLRKMVAYVVLPSIVHSGLHLAKGNELRLRHKGGLHKPWTGVGNVIKLPTNNGEEVGIIMKHIDIDLKSDFPVCCNNGFVVEIVWKSTSLARMLAALNRFTWDEANFAPKIYRSLMGHSAQEVVLDSNLSNDLRLGGKYLPNLNSSQVHAVKHALTRPLSLIQGPPGTGKTVTAVSIIYNLVRIHGGRVLVCAPSNTAVDNLTEKIQKIGIKCVRVCAKSKEGLKSSVASLSLHYQVRKLSRKKCPELCRLQQLKDEAGEVLSSTEERTYFSLKKQMEKKVLEAADVICCTCISAGDKIISHLKFHSILIDECTQSTEPESLVPIVLGSERLVLVGDQNQLGPVVLSQLAAKAGLLQSLFERLVNQGITSVRLIVQYRMHPDLAKFPSTYFYEGSLQNGVETHERTSYIDFPWPVPDKPIMFYATQDLEEISTSRTSYFNRAEASQVEKVTTQLLKAGIRPQQIGIITPYEGQRACVVNCMAHQGPLDTTLYRAIEVASVDAFQGREKDFIILTCVRSNIKAEIGFLSDPRRLNVALTRAKFGLIIIGNPEVLSKNQLWCNLIQYCKDLKALVEGPLSNLRESSIYLAKATPVVNEVNSRADFLQANTNNAEVMAPLSMNDAGPATPMNCDPSFLPAVFVRSLRCDSIDEKVLALEKLQTVQSTVVSSIPSDLKLQIYNQICVMINGTVRNGRHPETLTPLMEAVLDAIIALSCDSYFITAFKEGNELLEKITVWLKGLSSNVEERQLEKIVQCMLIITKNFRTIHKPKHLSDLVTVLLEFLNTCFIPSEVFIQSVNVLINMCGHSPACYLAVRSNNLLKVVLRRMTVFVQAKPPHFRSLFLIHHLMFVLECGVNNKLLEWGLKHAKSYTIKCLLDCESPKMVNSAKICLEELVGFVTTLLAQIKVRVDQFSPDEGFDPLDYEESEVSEEFVNIRTSCRRMLATITGPTLVHLWGRYKDPSKGKILDEHRETVINLLIALTPEFIPLKEVIHGHKAAFGLIKAMISFGGEAQQYLANEQVLDALVHLTHKVVEESDSRIREQFDEEIRFALKCSRLCKNQSNSLRVNIASCRIFTMVRGLPFVAADLENKLTERIIRDILEDHNTCPEEEFDGRSSCVIEILGVLADNSHMPQMLEILMFYISLPRTAKHITNGILSGNEQLINRSLTITGSIAFSRNSLCAVVKSLASSAGCGYVSPSVSHVEKSMVTPFATKGLARLDAALEPILETYNRREDEENPSENLLMQDVVSLYEMKCGAHETENKALREQVQEMARGTENLKKMLDKQSQIFSERLAESEKKDRQIQILSHNLQSSSEQLAAASSKIEKELAATSNLLNFKSNTLEKVQKDFEVLERNHHKLIKEYKDLQSKADKCEALRANSEELVNNLTKEKIQRDKELKEAKEQVAKLDRAVRGKEDERKRFEALLEKEKRTVDTIRGLLGNNIGAGLS